ncbi:MAG TPA: type II secretion system protein N [Steroidobacteraceae bacterium]|nr:type II secretion system protein N [Steroidobacteraceae bacterium]
MKRTLWISLLAIFAFAIILLVRLPVQWVAGFLPKNVSCAQLAGTAWEGSCGGLVARGLQIGNLTWELHPLALVSGKISVDVDVMRGTSFVRAEVESTFSGAKITARNVQADMPLDRALIPQLPPGLSGNARLNLVMIHVENGIVTSLQGLVEAHDLVDASGGQRTVLGDYSMTFPAADPAAEPVGQLMSLSGPLDVEGTLKLTREPGFVLEGLVAAGADASPKLVQQLAYLGSPDAQGKRPFSVAATF